MESGESGIYLAGQARSSWLDMPPLITGIYPRRGDQGSSSAAAYGQTASGAIMVEAGLTIAVIAGLFKGIRWPVVIPTPCKYRSQPALAICPDLYLGSGQTASCCYSLRAPA